MGCASSSAIPVLPEIQQLAPVEANFCAPSITTLRLRDRFWDSSNGEDFVVCDAEWGQEVFRIQGTTSAMKTLRDPLRNPLVHIKRELMAPVPTYNVFDAKMSATKLFSIKALPELHVEFQSPASSKMCRIGFTGNWAKRQVSFWMEQDGKIPRTAVGRVFRPADSHSSVTTTCSSSLSSNQPDDEYILTIMAGVDMSLMVLICIALEQGHSEKW
ncbi:unnamed protein product [Peronospora farinosa]|uniref:Tubby C-terminal-like domain-containing protein n=1 Tax=Peronospora farinosa TaxID=134698 RepID=A0AAV0UEN4_9STRA|nr:unnamed protein product [Peronospora farinosa]CAI5735236.1 unnamed protein product [Peronospora farinosa]